MKHIIVAVFICVVFPVAGFACSLKGMTESGFVVMEKCPKDIEDFVNRAAICKRYSKPEAQVNNNGTPASELLKNNRCASAEYTTDRRAILTKYEQDKAVFPVLNRALHIIYAN